MTHAARFNPHGDLIKALPLVPIISAFGDQHDFSISLGMIGNLAVREIWRVIHPMMSNSSVSYSYCS